MDLAGITSIDVGTSKRSYGRDNLDQEDFMRLLLQELSHQDPLNPMDSKEFTVQLTQFSSLEGINEINDSLNNLLSFQQSMQNATVTNLIGKSVKVGGNSAYLRGTATMSYELSESASSARIAISDTTGRVVRSEELGSQTAGAKNYIWDGRDDLGNQLSEGPYHFQVEALNASGNQVEVESHSSGYVTGVDFDDGVTYVVLDGDRRVYLSDIRSIVE